MNMRTRSVAFDSSQVVQSSQAEGLLRLIELDEGTATSWPAADTAGMFQHQLEAPLDFDLSVEGAPGLTTVAAFSELLQAQKTGIRTFADLFRHASPPLAVLKVSKDFFKRAARVHPQGSAEHQVAHACYLLSVVAARVHLGKRITNFSDAELRHNLKWALRQEWVGKPMRGLLKAAWTLLHEVQASAGD